VAARAAALGGGNDETPAIPIALFKMTRDDGGKLVGAGKREHGAARRRRAAPAISG
jgi:hypothetical protein